MLGFIALGSLQTGAYRQPEIELMQAFASQVAQVLEKAWMAEQSHRRTEELEVLSSISFALDQAESGENTLFAIVDQVTKFFGASQGAFLAPDRDELYLAVKVSQNEALVGMLHPRKDDLLWQTLAGGQTAVVADAHDPMYQNSAEIYRRLWGEARSAVLVPIRSADATFGILCLAFGERRRFTPQDMRLYNAVAEIAGASLHRAVILEALERQVEVRTQHLSTLYHINAVASEPLELQTILEQLLEVTLASLGSQAGAIHFLDERGGELYLAAHRNFPKDVFPAFESLSLTDRFWNDLVHSSTPFLVPDIASEPRAPAAMLQVREVVNQASPGNSKAGAAYIGAPIRAKGGVLGLLSLFGETVLDYTIEDITLFMTIADQIGSSVERARLMRQAEMAAVIEERQRLARELHDSVTQLLYSQVLFSGAGLKVLRQGNQRLAEQHIERIDQAAQQALREMRLLVYQLRPSDYLDDGLAYALQRRLEAVEKRTSIDAQLVLSGELDLDEAVEISLYRIAEEALNNTLKHAQASSVSVKITSSERKVVLEIADDGRGFDLEAARRSGGMGLDNMYERAAALGGKLQVLTNPGEGARIIVEIEVEK
jgi:signal transduction histidine kinase